LRAFLLRLADLRQDGRAAVLPVSQGPPCRPSRDHARDALADAADRRRPWASCTGARSSFDRYRIEDFCGPDPYPEGDERQVNVLAL
jgi:hypothetical protein